ncbi:hypothetical protein Ancab_007344 [Ancistrocladus abbreviatus]
MAEHQAEIEMPKPFKEDVHAMPLGVNCSCSCPFSMQDDILELERRSRSAVKLGALIIFYLIVMAVEVVGGIKANSLAILTDAAHLLADVAGFFISLLAVWASGWKATSYQSFGFYRLEVVGALLSVQLIWLISGILIYEAVDRILHESATVNGKVMFMVAAFGFVINLIMVIWLGHSHDHHACISKDHDHGREVACTVAEGETTKLVSTSPEKATTSNINIQGAYLHLLADMIQSIGVMIAGAIIWIKPQWLIIDLLCTTFFSILVLCSTLHMLNNIFSILMERAPSEVDIVGLEKGLEGIKGVSEIHDLHVWSITLGKNALSCHVIPESGVSCKEILHDMREYCGRTYRIAHVTIQVEEE